MKKISKKRAWFLAKHKMPISQYRQIVRTNGRICLRCLSRPVYKGKRCYVCYEERKTSNIGRKR